MPPLRLSSPSCARAGLEIQERGKVDEDEGVPAERETGRKTVCVDANVPLNESGVLEAVQALCRQAGGSGAVGAVGLELEAFPIRLGPAGEPAGRLLLDELAPVLSSLAEARRRPLVGSADGHGTAGRLTFEPGAQVEIVTAPHPDAVTALTAADGLERALSQRLSEQWAVLAHTGLDLWHAPGTVPQQLREPRYEAMAAYFARRPEPDGPVMMRHTCALQVNLDLGPERVAAERWVVANLVSPLLVGTFACSPTEDAASGRSQVWQRTDPTRTGVPAAVLRGENDPAAALAEAALAADVLLITDPDGSTKAGAPGWTFREWLRDGHPRHGRPTRGDLDRHLSTLFPMVRLRGWLEIRGIDALPGRWRPVPVVLLSGLLYDDRARAEALRVLEPHRRELPRLLHDAAATGVADPALCALAVEVWSFALAGARRLPTGFVATGHLALVEGFLDRFTLRGRCPADDLRERFAASPAAALAWAAGAADMPSFVP